MLGLLRLNLKESLVLFKFSTLEFFKMQIFKIKDFSNCKMSSKNKKL